MKKQINPFRFFLAIVVISAISTGCNSKSNNGETDKDNSVKTDSLKANNTIPINILDVWNIQVADSVI